MANNSLWQEDYWILLMQLYMRRPMGLKPLYSRQMMELCIELHLTPQFVYGKMFELRNAASARLKRLWERYGDKPAKLKRDAALVRSMAGFSKGDTFYEGVTIIETFEKDFRPIPKCGNITPVMLILILDLYFRLVPATMNENTPEIQELARTMRTKATDIVKVMDVYQILDPYLKRDELMITPLLKPCQQVWRRYGNGDIGELAAQAAQMKQYFE